MKVNENKLTRTVIFTYSLSRVKEQQYDNER